MDGNQFWWSYLYNCAGHCHHRNNTVRFLVLVVVIASGNLHHGVYYTQYKFVDHVSVGNSLSLMFLMRLYIDKKCGMT